MNLSTEIPDHTYIVIEENPGNSTLLRCHCTIIEETGEVGNDAGRPRCWTSMVMCDVGRHRRINWR